MSGRRVRPPALSVEHHVHITRAPRRSESGDAPITLEEWIAYVRSDPELFLHTADAADPGTRYGASVGVAWFADATASEGAPALFEPREGRITVSNPGPTVLAKMCQVAWAMGAQVRGDRGEIYPDVDPLPVSVRRSRERPPRLSRGRSSRGGGIPGRLLAAVFVLAPPLALQLFLASERWQTGSPMYTLLVFWGLFLGTAWLASLWPIAGLASHVIKRWIRRILA